MTAQTFFQSANQFFRDGKIEEAVACYRKAIEINPCFYHAHHNLGEALIKVGLIDDALVAFQQAVKLNPRAAWSLFKLGEILYHQKKFEESGIVLRQAVKLNSDIAEFNFALGTTLVSLGGAKDEAENFLLRAKELNPFLEYVYGINEICPKLAQDKREDEKNNLQIVKNEVDNLDKQSIEIGPDLLEQLKLGFNQLLQTKKTLYSGLPEFGYELISVLPYAYYLYEQKKLEQTISGYDTKSLYFFSLNHIEIKEKRSWSNVQKLQESHFPNIHIHQGQLNWKLFSPPPINQYYQDTAIRFAKPTLVICNRYNDEWEGEPINYINGQVLRQLFKILHKDYQIVYVNQIFFGSEYEDDAKPMYLDEASIISDFSGDVITFKDLMNLYPNNSINELQCRIYAGCDRFISSNGGFGILCSYFGGENIIFTKLCRELDPSVNSFCAWYSKLSQSTISVAKTESKLIDMCKRKWIDNAPLFNIIIRTSGRPNYFHDCMRSIYEQSYSNINIIVGIDDERSLSYLQGHSCTIVTLDKYDGNPQVPPRKSEEYGLWFPYNNYFNKLLVYANVGYVIYLDDDDCFASENSLLELASKIIETQAELIFWRVLFPDNLLIPSDSNWKKQTPINRDISGIGFCHTTAIIPDWEPWKRGDYRVAKYLMENTKKNYWFDHIITTTQRKTAGGYGRKDDKLSIQSNLTPPLIIIINAFEDHNYLEESLDSIMSQTIPDKCPNLRVLVAVDRCLHTRKLTRKYSPNVEFYFTDKGNFGKYMMYNSLLLKVVRRDSIILFFEPEDIMTPGFLHSYYLRFQDLNYKNTNNYLKEESDTLLDTILHTQYITMYDHEINTQILNNNYMKFESSLTEGKSNNTKARQFKMSYGVFFLSYFTLEKLGFFFTDRVGQDYDILMRAKAMKMNINYDNSQPYFIKQLHSPLSVHLSNEADENYKIEKVHKETEKRLANGKYVAEKKALTLKILT